MAGTLTRGCPPFLRSGVQVGHQDRRGITRNSVGDTVTAMNGELVCDKCGSAFLGRSDAKYCSTACKQRAYRERRDEASAASRPHFQKPRLPARALRAVLDLGRVCDRLEWIMADGRYKHNAEAIRRSYRGDLLRARETIDKMLAEYP